MFSAHLGKELRGRASGPRFHVFSAPPDALNGFLIIGALPLEIRGQRLIKRVGNALSVPLGIVVQLGLTFRFNGYCFHASRVRIESPCVKRGTPSTPSAGHHAVMGAQSRRESVSPTGFRNRRHSPLIPPMITSWRTPCKQA
jgi:hypothetical protein